MTDAIPPRNRTVILVVDDSSANIDIIVGALGTDGEYEIRAATSGEMALRLARAQPRIDMILLDVMMPGMDGYETCRRLKEDPVTAEIPVIFVTAMNDASDEAHGFELGAVDYLSKPVSAPILRARMKTHLALHDHKRELASEVRLRTEELNHTRQKIILQLGHAAEYRDNETGLHVVRMSHYSRSIAQVVVGNPAWVDLLFNAAPMHDVGKIGIPDRVLLKPGKLDAGEWEIMKTHSAIGADIIGEDEAALLCMSRQIALMHHEKWDGGGYPFGLAGAAIPLEARIVAIADVFDALTSSRPYKHAWPLDQAIAYIHDQSGTGFDPELVSAFDAVLPDIIEIGRRLADEPRAG